MRIGDRTVYITDDDNVTHRLNPGDSVPADLEQYFVSDGEQHRALQGDGPAVEVDDTGVELYEGDEETESTDGATDYESLKVAELQEQLKARELPQGGNRAELIARLREADAESVDEDDEPIEPDEGDDTEE